ncbi:MAG: NFACT family protein [Firmicutes bacterium]|nr:NFACT family protein [Bacillota bacterium]
MAMDGILISVIKKQLQDLLPCKINKIHNISDEEIVFTIKPYNLPSSRLVMNVHSNTNRLFLANYLENSSQSPSNFVMVLRKMISSGIIESIEQKNYDRILSFSIRAYNEFGDLNTFHLQLELMGKYANLILVDSKGIIIDALKRIPVYENSKRFVHPGATYVFPEQETKQDPFHVESIDENTSLIKQIYGFSPILSTEFLYRMKNGQAYEDIMKELYNSDTLYVYEKDFHGIELTHLKKEYKTYPLMEGFNQLYNQVEQKARIKEQCGDVFRCVEKEKAKALKKLPKLQDAFEKSMDYEKYKEYGDLLFCYMYSLKKQPTVIVPSFETGEDVSIPIDMRFDFKTNANKYYQKYHKLKRGQDILLEQMDFCQEDIDYFTQLSIQLQSCSIEDALEIKEELINHKILFEKKSHNNRRKKKIPNILHLRLEDADIYVGKNNVQNNYVTHQISRKNDLWFHVKDYHGSHVLLKQEEPNEETIRLCANLAAYFSKGKNSSSVPVDYCPISQIKKVPGSKIGFVTMKSYKTIYIDPDANAIEKTIKELKV